jgi:hypothetical protein
LKTCPAFPQPFSDSRSPLQSTFSGKGSKVHTQKILLGFIITTAVQAEDPSIIFSPVAEKHIIEDPAILEASGLAASCADPNFLWIVNDSGAEPDIHLITTDGKSRGKVRVSKAINSDWEDLASFKLDGKSYLLVADAGDNNAIRNTYQLFILLEPSLPKEGKNLDAVVNVAWQIEFQYEDGPRDCESVAVDTAAEKIILISKRTKPPEIYELPLRPTKNIKSLTANKIGQTQVESPAGKAIPFGDQPCGLDINSDQSLATVVTYYSVFLFPRKPTESWAEAFSHKPITLKPHKLPQAESIAFSRDGKTIFTITEGKNSPILRYQRSGHPHLTNADD